MELLYFNTKHNDIGCVISKHDSKTSVITELLRINRKVGNTYREGELLKDKELSDIVKNAYKGKDISYVGKNFTIIDVGERKIEKSIIVFTSHFCSLEEGTGGNKVMVYNTSEEAVFGLLKEFKRRIDGKYIQSLAAYISDDEISDLVKKLAAEENLTTLSDYFSIVDLTEQTVNI